MGQGQEALPDMLTHIANFAVDAIPGADGAGLTLLEQDWRSTIVATADFVSAVDKIQYSIGEGPCISAAAEGRTMRSGAVGTDPLWPRFGPRVARLGVHSVLSLPLIGDEVVLGAINVYAHAPNAFNDRAVELGELFAVPAAISVQTSQALFQARRLATQLQAALTSRATIDQAIGILMSRSGGTPDEAFDRMRSVSQAENQKVAVVAQRIVDEAVRRARARHVDR
jgi:GAF domain-containing protein